MNKDTLARWGWLSFALFLMGMTPWALLFIATKMGLPIPAWATTFVGASIYALPVWAVVELPRRVVRRVVWMRELRADRRQPA